MADDPWAMAAADQEQSEQKRKLEEKMKEMMIRNQRRSQSIDEQQPQQQPIKKDGWPVLPEENTNSRNDSGGGGGGNTGWDNDSRRPPIGGAGRGRSIKNDQRIGGSGGVGGAGNGNQFGGGYNTSNFSQQQQSFGDQGGNRNHPPSASNFNFNTSAANNTGPKNISSVFGGVGGNSDFGGGEANSKLSFGSSFGSLGGGAGGRGGGGGGGQRNNWNPGQNDGAQSQSTTTRWPQLDESPEQRNQFLKSENKTPPPASVFPTGGSSTIGRLQEESWDEESSEKPLDNLETSLLNKILHDKLNDSSKYDVEIERQNPNNPLFSIKSFDELRLSDELLRGIQEMNFHYPSKIQESALPKLLADPPQNMIAQSQSGTGKTAAFVLTMLSRVDPNLRHPQCLCLSPTYELALQIGRVVEKMGKYLTSVKVAYATRGGLRLERGGKVQEQIIIGTAGTVLDWIVKFRAFDPKLLTVFVLDEADLMIGVQGQQDSSIRIHKSLAPECQRLLFSATYDDQVMDFADKIINDPIVIRLRRDEETLDYIKQYFVACQRREDKYRALCNIYGTLTIGQAMIFCRTKKEANWLAGQMSTDGHTVALLTGDLDIEQRAAVIDRFKRGSEKVLISTNLTARGIDVEQVTIVVNYDLPTTTDGHPDFEAYLHRIGRTGRFGKAGIAINFIDTNWSKNIMEQIESHFGKKVMPLDTEDVDALGEIENVDN